MKLQFSVDRHFHNNYIFYENDNFGMEILIEVNYVSHSLNDV